VLRRFLARAWRGARADAALAAARRDLAAMPLDDAVARRGASPLSPLRRARALRATAVALAVRLERDGETHPCLVRALALFEVARECGFDVSLAVGVRGSATGAFDSHAWLVLGGEPFLEDHARATPYETVTVLPPAGSGGGASA
jgi:transglutaminase superfamily protein